MKPGCTLTFDQFLRERPNQPFAQTWPEYLKADCAPDRLHRLTVIALGDPKREDVKAAWRLLAKYSKLKGTNP